MRFHKYQALGNDYIVLHPQDVGSPPKPAQIRRICHRNYGVGSDGILYGPLETEGGGLGLRIFNPDGSEAEKSGNGLRIFARYLLDLGIVGNEAFTIDTAGGSVVARVHEGGALVTVEMGRVGFGSREIPVNGPDRDVINETMHVGGRNLTFCAATVGNPHCVVLCRDVSPEQARTLGPLIETHHLFPNRTNVQFMKVIDRGSIRIEIWERGAGYTLASGSSSSACAAAARKLDLCDEHIAVHMPGGRIDITVAEDFSITMNGPVGKICEGTLSEEIDAAAPNHYING